MHWINVLRDVALIYILLVAGFLAVEAMAGPEGLSSGSTVLWLVLLTSAGFAVSGALAGSARWGHLVAVAVVAWLLSMSALILFHISFAEWLAALPFLLVCMTLGGGLSYLLPRPRDSSRTNEYLD